jgi:hypothetical protein
VMVVLNHMTVARNADQNPVVALSSANQKRVALLVI